MKMDPTLPTDEQILQMQGAQFAHDKRNHADILCLHKVDRLKHYGLHYCKYVGRFAREDAGSKPVRQTLADILLVNLSCANTLHQKLKAVTGSDMGNLSPQMDALRPFADAAGRFADACEKVDHLEEFVSIALTANADIFWWAWQYSSLLGVDLRSVILERRQQLRLRPFYILD